ncbi:MAG TPA: hypothetical protein VIS29_14505 [Streptomyces sp.]
MRHKVRPSTVYSYSKCVNAYIVPRLGKKKLARLSAKDVHLFLDWARQACQCCAQGRDAAGPGGEAPLRRDAQAVLRASAVTTHGPVPARGAAERSAARRPRGVECGTPPHTVHLWLGKLDHTLASRPTQSDIVFVRLNVLLASVRRRYGRDAASSAG